MSDERIRKARRHVNQSEGLIFEVSSAGKRGMELPKLDVPAADAKRELGSDLVRDDVEGFP
ncbi:MAG: aminomethyl-transferring glycine dehydrogenase subunit GcvPB, partial [Acidobacteriota bacterium]|nr:aminomethyl-transferring glycine dehydrogenase subunit GcvPB [Acidobacteriota bacterium]